MKHATSSRWILAAALLVFVAAPLRADPPETTPGGAQPATPGGGNPHAGSPNAATPATPPAQAQEPPSVPVGDMDDASRSDLIGQNEDLRAEAKAKWEAMTPEQREQFLKDHPRLARRMLRKKWDAMTPAERAGFVSEHPELRARLQERWQSMTPEQRRAFLDRHPRLARRLARERRDRRDDRTDQPQAPQGNNGVRDHGAGEGRGGVGQGGEHRAPGGGPKR